MATARLPPNHRARVGARAEGGSSVEAAVPCGSGGCSAQAAPESHIRIGKVAWGGEGLAKGALTRRQHFRCSRSRDRIGCEGGVAAVPITPFYSSEGREHKLQREKQWVFSPRVRPRGQRLSEMPHVQVADPSPTRMRPRLHPLVGARRVVASTGPSNQNAPTQRKRVAFRGGAPAACVSMATVSGGPANLSG